MVRTASFLAALLGSSLLFAACIIYEPAPVSPQPQPGAAAAPGQAPTEGAAVAPPGEVTAPVAAPAVTPVDGATVSEPPPAATIYDCASPPARRCCRANTPACRQCAQEGAAERAAWNAQCEPAGTPAAAPVPAPDCSTAPAIRMCCQAELESCHQCKREADAELARWDAACAPSNL